MPGMKALFDDKRLAIVEVSGSPTPTTAISSPWTSGRARSRRHRRGRGGWAAGSTRPARTRCARLASARPCRSPSPGRRSKGGDPHRQAPAARYRQPAGPLRRHGQGDSGEPALLAGSASADANLLVVDRTLGPILNRTVDSDPLHVKASDSVALAGSSAAALAIANGGEASRVATCSPPSSASWPT